MGCTERTDTLTAAVSSEGRSKSTYASVTQTRQTWKAQSVGGDEHLHLWHLSSTTLATQPNCLNVLPRINIFSETYKPTLPESTKPQMSSTKR